jgi:glycosyltransferase involved in cell wall biosynthesis
MLAVGSHPPYACGAALIASDHAPTRLLLENHQTGWLIDPADPNELIAAIKDAIRDRKQTHIMGANARELVEALPIDTGSIVDGFSEIYQRSYSYSSKSEW